MPGPQIRNDLRAQQRTRWSRHKLKKRGVFACDSARTHTQACIRTHKSTHVNVHTGTRGHVQAQTRTNEDTRTQQTTHAHRHTRLHTCMHVTHAHVHAAHSPNRDTVSLIPVWRGRQSPDTRVCGLLHTGDSSAKGGENEDPRTEVRQPPRSGSLIQTQPFRPPRWGLFGNILESSSSASCL